ncbi:MAG TPA: hypothetical protein PLH86_04260 [Saprospiraceae bacterium]|nr:hypothetical protein [Saprospiraceae bacterium]
MKKLVLYFLFIITNFLNAQCWQKVSMGSHHALAIKNDGSLWSWGANFYGQLGDGTSVSKSSPVQIGFSQDWSVISAGAGHSMAIKNDGTLWAWGSINLDNWAMAHILTKTSRLKLDKPKIGFL